MREAFAHEALVELSPGSDEGAVGAAVTVELCGHWEHDGPCRWPHHTSVHPRDSAFLIRTIFACPPADQSEVRERVIAGLRAGVLTSGPTPSSWSLLQEGTTSVNESETALAGRLAGP